MWYTFVMDRATEETTIMIDDPNGVYADQPAVSPYQPGSEEERDWLQSLSDEELAALPRTLAVQCELDERPIDDQDY